ncbi:MAG: nucleotide-binding protein [Deltaproteobacteria bacterium]|nr:nucleotide-binding protein [Deltaproteobacteria bacterium]
MPSRRSKIVINAERILDVLISNNAVTGNDLVVRKIKELVKLEEKDFDSADTYLQQAGYVDGTMGGDDGTLSVTGAGIEFYETLAPQEPDQGFQSEIPLIFAKLAGIYKIVGAILSKTGRYYDPAYVMECFERSYRISDRLREILPGLYSDLPLRSLPKGSGTTDFEGRGYIERLEMEHLKEDLEYIFEVRSHSKLGELEDVATPDSVFISHGSSNDWREVQAYVEKDLQIKILELAQEPNRGRTILQKLAEESNRCSYAVIVMTGDDDVGREKPRARENVMHEIGYFQGKYGLRRICLLYEEGTSIPSNIHGLLYIPFPKGLVRATFGALARELRAVFKM